MNNMYQPLCIRSPDHHLKVCIVRSFMSSFESLYSRLCSSTAGTSRKQVTKSSLRCFFSLLLIHQLSRYLN